MSKTTIGLIFIIFGCAYGSLAVQKINSATLGYLLTNGWIKPPKTESGEQTLLGSKGQIILFALILNAIGIFILWNRNS